MPLYLGVDVGTSGTKALLLSPSGRIVGTAVAAHPELHPKPGWSEQRPSDWWASARAAIRSVLRRGRADPKAVSAIGLSGQMHGAVVLDRRGAPLCNALLWNDQRTTAECAELERAAGGRAALIHRVRNVALTGYQAPKLLWLRRHQRRAFARIATVLLPKDYLRYRLTGTRGSEVSDASGTLLLDVARRHWSYDLMNRLRLDPAWFGDVVESTTVIGGLTAAAARACGLRPDTPVVAGAGDQAAAGVGTGVVRPGVMSATIGTSGVVFAFSPLPAPNDAGLLQSFCHAVPGAWCVFGCMLAAGASLQWLREVLLAGELRRPSAAQRDRLYTRLIAEALSDGRREAPLFHPYLSGERCPYPHPHARGAFLGLTRAHSRADLTRAVLEGVTLGMARQVELMRSAGIRASEIRLAGGGARSPRWCQLQADAYRCTACTLATQEGSALGAAILAAVGIGAFADVPSACDQLLQVGARYRPDAARSRALRRTATRLARSYELLEPEYRAASAKR